MLLREEYPRPQFQRENWQVLNGLWSFDFDDNNIGIVKKYYEGTTMLSKEIVVPFAYQCKESQINDQSKHNILWYKRKISLNQSMKNKEIILCFNGVDYECSIWVNGKFAATHKNGYSYFEVNITDLTEANANVTIPEGVELKLASGWINFDDSSSSEEWYMWTFYDGFITKEKSAAVLNAMLTVPVLTDVAINYTPEEWGAMVDNVAVNGGGTGGGITEERVNELIQAALAQYRNAEQGAY